MIQRVLTVGDAPFRTGPELPPASRRSLSVDRLTLPASLAAASYLSRWRRENRLWPTSASPKAPVLRLPARPSGDVPGHEDSHTLLQLVNVVLLELRARTYSGDGLAHNRPQPLHGCSRAGE